MFKEELGNFDSLEILPTGRWPNRLPDTSVQMILEWPTPRRPENSRRSFSATDLVSIIIVTANGFVFTKLCLTALFLNSTDCPYELILVDNASSDGTEVLIRQASETNDHVHAIFNRTNAGFAAGVNQGLRRAVGNQLVLLNSDTVVSKGWLPTLSRHLRSPGVGLVGPVTNRCGNEAEIRSGYQTYGELAQFARSQRSSRSNRYFEIPMLSMFCLAMTRPVYRKLGLLDERFETGLFEDDDYSLRALEAGYKLICAEDCFVHHYGQVSFGQAASAEDYSALLRKNQKRFELKWQRKWIPHQSRNDAEYSSLRSRLAEAVRPRIPPGSKVLVISRGDADLIHLLGNGFHHFPQAVDGSYAGFYPEDSQGCIDHLEELMKKGFEYLIVPTTYLWWLRYYDGWNEHLNRNYPILLEQAGVGVIYQLNPTDAVPSMEE